MAAAPETIYTVLRDIALYADLSSASSWEKGVYLKWCVKLGGSF